MHLNLYEKNVMALLLGMALGLFGIKNYVSFIRYGSYLVWYRKHMPLLLSMSRTLFGMKNMPLLLGTALSLFGIRIVCLFN